MSIIEGFSPGFIDEQRDAAEALFTGISYDFTCYVEAEVDVYFWQKRFASQLTLDVDIRPINTEEPANGKGTIISAVTRHDAPLILTKKTVVCLDSDYDNLLSKNQPFYASDFVFQTYSYAIENIYYHPEKLGEYIQQCSGIQDIHSLDLIEGQVNDWSLKYFDSFCYLLLNGRNKEDIAELSTNLELSNIRVNQSSDQVTQEESADLSLQGLNNSSLHLFYRGHNFESVMYVNLICKYLTKLRKIKKNEIENNSEIQDKGAAIEALFSEDLKIKDKLKDRDLNHIDVVQKIDNDIQHFNNTYWP